MREASNLGVRGHVRAFESGDMSPHSKNPTVKPIRVYWCSFEVISDQ